MTVLLANAPTRIAQNGHRELFYVKAGSRWPFSIEKDTAETPRYVPFPFSLAYLAALPAEYVEDFTMRAPSVWLRSRVKDPSWLARQTKYFARVARDQGIPGRARRVERGYRLFFNLAR